MDNYYPTPNEIQLENEINALKKALHEVMRDSDRYRWLKTHCIKEIPESRDGPQYPELSFAWDIWNKSNKNGVYLFMQSTYLLTITF